MARFPKCSLAGIAGLLGVLTISVGACADVSSSSPLSREMIARVLTPTEIIAEVGDQTILAGDVLPTIDRMLDGVRQEIPAYQLEQLDQQRALYVQQLLPKKIEFKLVLLDFRRTIPPDKLKEVRANIKKQVDKQFYDEQVPLLQKQLAVESLSDLEMKLNSFGTSIEMQKAQFREQMVARTMILQTVDRFPEVTHSGLLNYYYQHIEDYKIPARAKWEKLTARFDKFPDKAAADRAIVDMGNQVLKGAKFSAVAKKHSQGTNAWDGGRHDWTTKGSLVSTVLDRAIFTLPRHRLSAILTDNRGFHIVRVLERQEAGQVPFERAQEEIRKKLQDEKRQRQQDEYLEKLREKTYVWTIFDDIQNVASNTQHPTSNIQ